MRKAFTVKRSMQLLSKSLKSATKGLMAIAGPSTANLHTSTSALAATSAQSTSNFAAPFPVLTTVSSLKKWREKARHEGKKVGFVATMGALHSGHLNLVQNSLEQCDLTIVSIFVNPAQFAPTEDLTTYPRTLEKDIEALTQASQSTKSVSALFLPAVKDLYPLGIEQDVSKQIGTFVEVKGFSHQMEGTSRPTFFRGVATVVTKLFNLVQPDQTFFGQKDIQQCMILRQMLRDLHFPFPPTPHDLVIVPTTRDENSGLALSSRNTYLSEEERLVAPTLAKALQAGAKLFKQQRSENDGRVDAVKVIEEARASMRKAVNSSTQALRLDYIAINDPETLQDLITVEAGQGAILSGAMWCGKTRLIDNLVLDYDLNPRQTNPAVF